MPMRDVPRDEWAEYLDGFSRQHEGWPVTVEVLGAEVGAQVEAHELPLQGVTAELKGGGEDAITVIVGGGVVERVTHTVARPAHVRVEQSESGADLTLQLESSDGVATLVRVRPPVPPETFGVVTS
jgi:hypothetical protein